MDYNKREKYNFDELVEIIAKLRAPGGCPWDREQTHESIRKSLIEEAYELVEAIDDKKPEKIADESGDVLLQVMLHAQIAQDNSEYDISDVIDVLCRKMIHRHPHVFGDVDVENSEQVLKNWDAIKRGDRHQQSITDELKGVSAYIPTLMRAQKIYKKAKKAGYEYSAQTTDVKTEEAFGKLLFDISVAAESHGIDPEVALSGYINKFIEDFEEFEEKK
ncbi:MAG: MazG family protein [Clostridia bacterium]|nr:MazG family protein [Clostridia bacterium]